ncbi:VOC family protein [bacterium]|nr:MAG: VOC family protein [bacterium]
MSETQCNFIWYELMTSDAAASEAFYKAVVGWGIEDAGMPGPMKYSMLTVEGKGIGGMMEMTPEMCADAKPSWTGYIAVPDTDAFAAKIKEEGGAVYREPEDIPMVGRFAVVADPHGAVFEIMTPSPEGEMNWPDFKLQGMPGWRELHAGDNDEAWAFYSELFGWTQSGGMDMGEMGIYRIFDCDGKPIGGMLTKMPDTPAPTWVYYFNVDDINAAVTRVKDNGGQILMGPHEVPGGTWIVQCMDPHGALFALMTPGGDYSA